MFRKILSIIAMSSILLISGNLVSAQTKGNWAAVENIVGQEVAVKTQNGKMQYGIIKSVDANSLVLQTAGNKGLTQNEITINQNDVKKLWRALLFVNDRNTGKGALIGAGIGAGAGFITYAATRNDGPLAGAAVPLYTVVGAGIGAAVGFFVKKKHKKRDLVYKQ